MIFFKEFLNILNKRRTNVCRRRFMKKNNIIKRKYKTKHKHIRYFKQYSFEETVTIPEQKPDIEDIVSTMVEPEIVSTRIINTPKGKSFEGQKLTGKKVSIEIKLKQKITYVADKSTQSVHAVHNETYHSTFIVIPNLIEGCSPEVLLKNNLLKPKVLIEDIQGRKVDERHIFKNITIFIEVCLPPNYLVCYSQNCNCHESYLYIDYEDCEHKKEVIHFDNCKISDPQWSPDGQKIGFIRYDKNSSTLCISHIRSLMTEEVTDSHVFKYVTGFNWSKDSENIVFTAYIRNKKEIFVLNVDSCQWRQLTFSQNNSYNFKAKYSLDGEKIAYLRALDNYTNLFIMKKNGLGTKQLTRYENIRDYEWLNENEIIYICYDIDNGYKIIILNLQNYDEIELPNADLDIRKIKISPDRKYVGFIGSDFDIDNIYTYNLDSYEFRNITDYHHEISISDFDWKNNSEQIYFSCDELGCYNIYSVYIYDEEITQLSNSDASNINISYRPKII